MELTGIISILLIAANVIVSIRGFNNQSFFAKYAFSVDKVMLYKDHKVLLTSGFLHVNWMHLIFNMISLYLFSEGLAYYTGTFRYLLIYFASLVGGNLFSLLVHRRQGYYTAVGASGAVCGLIFAAIALFPGMRIGFFFLPISIPAWLYGIAFVLYSVYGIRSGKNNIGHEAHLAGAVIGMLTASVLFPAAARENIILILLLFIPATTLIWIMLRNPAIFHTGG
ncbi:MAG TPA: rhomboid family intramembrane serine protease, partial [Chitinophagaceae bacterium]|nr:rhomboid family intramembrane serine protease [Chitinophagaceae bacterium]